MVPRAQVGWASMPVLVLLDILDPTALVCAENKLDLQVCIIFVN